MRRVAFLVTMGFGALALAPVSFAQTTVPTSGAGEGGGVQGAVGGGDVAGNLPFTGLNIVLFFLGGLALLAAGFALRAVSSRS